MKKSLILALSVLMIIGLLTGCQTTKDDDTLVVGMELAYPPFETKTEEGEPTGISVDFAKDFGEYIGKDVVIENIAWDGLIPSLQTGKADMVVSSMTITADRQETVDFSKPYANAMLAVLTNKDSGIDIIDDLNQPGKKVCS